MMNSEELRKEAKKEEALRILSRRNLIDFTRYTFDAFKPAPFHLAYYKILDLFAQGKIKNLIISMPPQHGKSEGSSRRLSSYLLGKNPDLKIGIATYNQKFSRKFNRDNQRIIDSQKYHNLFPETNLCSVGAINSKFIRTADEFEIVDSEGGLNNVGRGSAFTGLTVDIAILDDVYKDYAEAKSPVIRESSIDWYSTVVNTRLHNDSQRLLVFTRWDEEDLIGHIETTEEVEIIESFSQLEDPDPEKWYKINFEAIKTGKPTEIDPRKKGEPLWPEKHSLKNLLKAKALDPEKFESLYQGNPRPAEGILYKRFTEYDTLPDIVKKGNYTDTADTGKDKLCSICYNKGNDGLIYVTDILYTDEPMEVTEPATAKMLDKNGTVEADIESNNGGRGFARNVKKLLTSRCDVKWFHQGGNKESRILTNSATVQQYVVFPKGWILKWPEFANDVLRYKRMFSANNFDDAPDTLTGMVEKNIESEYASIRRYA